MHRVTVLMDIWFTDFKDAHDFALSANWDAIEDRHNKANVGEYPGTRMEILSTRINLEDARICRFGTIDQTWEFSRLPVRQGGE